MKLSQRIDALLQTQPIAFQESVESNFAEFWNRAQHEPGECKVAFQKLLPKRSISITAHSNKPPIFRGQSKDAKIAAAVFAKIFAIEVDGKQSGWDGLNADAKGWCRNFLNAITMAKYTAQELHDITIAKAFIGMLMDIPSGPRTITLPDSPFDRPGLLGAPGGIDS